MRRDCKSSLMIGACLTNGHMPDLRRLSAPDGVLRLGRRGETLLARLEIRDQALGGAIEDRAVTLDRGGVGGAHAAAQGRGLSLVAVASLFVTAIFGVPALTSRLMPSSRSRSSTSSATRSTRRSVLRSTTRHLGPAFGCGTGAGEAPGRAALDKLVGKLAAAAQLPFPLRVDVVRRSEPNAFALPGGHIYVYQGLIDRAQSPDELAGVLAHEMGHVAHRDGTRTVLQTAGLSFLFGMMLGDFVGGGAVVIAGQDRAASRRIRAGSRRRRTPIASR